MGMGGQVEKCYEELKGAPRKSHEGAVTAAQFCQNNRHLTGSWLIGR